MSETSIPRAVVVGLGASGVAAARLLVHQGWRVTVTDLKPRGDLERRLAELPATVATVLGSHPPDLLPGTSLVVTSPGVAWDAPFLVQARDLGIDVLAEVEVAYRSRSAVPIAGVTGSNGKSTVTALIGAIFSAAGLHVGVGGNIGHPACALALEGGYDAWVLELSSFQLEGSVLLRPHVGLLLNLSPDHLDRHAGMAEYRALKARLFANQDASDWAILNADDPAVASLSLPSTVARFSLRDRRSEAHLADDTLVLDGAPLLRRAELPLLGDHNVANALAAALGASRMGVAAEAVAAALRTFEGLPHRHQIVAQGNGVRWVEDSKGTNIGATAAGLAGYAAGTVHLILGGLGKGQDFHALRTAVTGRVACAYLIGRAAEDIAAALEGTVPLERCDTIEEAVRRAAGRARPGDTVLLSPACASFDQFRDYADRGEAFARLARAAAGGG